MRHTIRRNTDLLDGTTRSLAKVSGAGTETAHIVNVHSSSDGPSGDEDGDGRPQPMETSDPPGGVTNRPGARQPSSFGPTRGWKDACAFVSAYDVGPEAGTPCQISPDAKATTLPRTSPPAPLRRVRR